MIAHAVGDTPSGFAESAENAPFAIAAFAEFAAIPASATKIRASVVVIMCPDDDIDDNLWHGVKTVPPPILTGKSATAVPIAAVANLS